jgi:hypothetical protein
MAHFAEIGLNNTVTRVIVVSNDDCKDQYGNESEIIGAKFCNSLFGGVWLKTSYNGTIRKNYAGIGFTYDSIRDAFIAPKPDDLWILDETTCQWMPPVES